MDKVLRFVSSSVYASGGEPPRLGQLAAGLDQLIDWIFPIGVLIAAAMFVYGGYMWITSGGDPGRLQQAQGVLTWSILGLIFLYLIRTILLLIVNYIY